MTSNLPARALRCLARQLPAAIGWSMALFTAFNLLGEILRPGFDANFTWMPLRPETWWGTRLLMAAFAALLFWSLIRPAREPWRYAATQAILLFLFLVAAWDGLRFYIQILQGTIKSSLPFPFTWLVAIALATQLRRVRPPRNPAAPSHHLEDPPLRVLAATAGIGLVVLVFFLGQFFLWGRVSHARRADCAVILGAAVHWDGRPSRSLYDRTRTGCELYRSGLAGHLIFSGGPGPPGVTEPQAMQSVAVEMGLPPHAYILDERGHSTFDTVLSVHNIMKQRHWRTALIVTHDYHLSRTHLTFRRARITVHTVPAERSGHPLKEVRTVLREIPAWIYYYLRPLWQPLPPRQSPSRHSAIPTPQSAIHNYPLRLRSIVESAIYPPCRTKYRARVHHTSGPAPFGQLGTLLRSPLETTE